MIHCKRCNIYVEEDRSHCPLCGKCVSEENIGRKRVNEFYPDYARWRKDRINVASLLTVLLISLNAVWLVLELIIFRKLNLTWFFLTGSGVAFLVLIWPFARRQSFSNRNIIGIPVVCVFLFFIEAYTNTYGWGVGVVVPFLLTGNAVAVTIVMTARGYYRKSTMFPCLFTAMLSTAIFLINTLSRYAIDIPLWPSIAALATSWGCFAILFGVRYKKIMKGLKKDFHI